MKNKKHTNPSDIKSDTKNTSKKNNHIKDTNNRYLFIQIIITAIFVVASLMLKNNNSNAFYQVKDDYKAFFTTETVYESNFTYNSFFENLTIDIKEKYEALTQTIAYLYGKGKSDIYPSNISFEKYIPDEKGIKPFNGYISSKFGIRNDPFDKSKKDFHTGLDIAAAKGTFIKASFSGTVIETGYNNISGNYIKIKCNDDTQTFYGHTQFIFVKNGDSITKGQVIATVGDSGLVTGPHLHLEIIYKGNRVNPVYAIEL